MTSLVAQAPRSETKFGGIDARPAWSASYRENMAYQPQHYVGGHDEYPAAASGLPGAARMSASENTSAGRPTLPPLSSLLSSRAASRNASRQSPARVDSPEAVSMSDKYAARQHQEQQRRLSSVASPKPDAHPMMQPPQQYHAQSSQRWHAQETADLREDPEGNSAAHGRARLGSSMHTPSSRPSPPLHAEQNSRRAVYTAGNSHESSSLRTSQMRAEREHGLPPLTALNILSPRKELSTSPHARHTQHTLSTPSMHDDEGSEQDPHRLQPGRHHSFSIASGSHASTSPVDARRHPAVFPPHDARSPRLEQVRPAMQSSPHGAVSAHGRRRWSDDAPNDKEVHGDYEMEIFDRLWDMLMYVRQQNDQHDMARSPSAVRPASTMPVVRKGDFIGVSAYIRREIDALHERDPQLARFLADDEFALLEQQKQYRLSTIASAHSTQHPSQESRFGPERTGRRSTYTLGSGSSIAPNSAVRASSSRYEYLGNHNNRGSLPPFAQRGEPAYPYHSAGPYGIPHRGSQGSDYWDQRHDPRHFERGMPRYPLHEDELMHHHHHPQYAAQQHMAGANAMPRRVRKRRDEADQSCLSCAATETPEWRKGPTGPRTLCNACGLLFAKQCRKRELDAQARGERPKGGRALAPEDMTAEEKERSLVELQMAVHARTGQATGVPPTMAQAAVGGLPGRH